MVGRIFLGLAPARLVQVDRPTSEINLRRNIEVEDGLRTGAGTKRDNAIAEDMIVQSRISAQAVSLDRIQEMGEFLVSWKPVPRWPTGKLVILET